MNWNELILLESTKDYYHKLQSYIEKERLNGTVYPPEEMTLRAFELTPFEAVKVVILGQDPYHQPGQAMGLSFSVNEDQPLPKSLINIFNELKRDVGICPDSGDLTGWATQGVLLLNTILTVRESEPLSHAHKGWETFTDKVLIELGKRDEPIIFVLWGKEAQKKENLIQKSQHIILKTSHPSPLGAYRGFKGCGHFSEINRYLSAIYGTQIDWSK